MQLFVVGDVPPDFPPDVQIITTYPISLADVLPIEGEFAVI